MLKHLNKFMFFLIPLCGFYPKILQFGFGKNGNDFCTWLTICRNTINFLLSLMFSPFRYDRKNLGCLWDRTHPSPYFYILIGTVVSIPTCVITVCYCQIYLHYTRSRKMVGISTYIALRGWSCLYNRSILKRYRCR